MSDPQLGRMKRVDLRNVWSTEAGSFTPWLAREENLQLLGEAIGIELELETTEKDVGPFRADILCKDTATGHWVLIENQLARTDHTHLGQLITYAAGLNAVTVVWIAERFTEEHRAALDWLNERTDEDIHLFGLEIELWQIGSSEIAPKFNTVCQPNDWSRTVQTEAKKKGLSEHRLFQHRLWSAFADFMVEKSSFLKCPKAQPNHWMSFSIGRSGFNLSAVVSTWNTVTKAWENEIRAELVLTGPEAKSDFAELQKHQERIESKLGFKLGWHNPANAASCRIYVRMDANFQDESAWPEHFAWMKERLEALHRVFAPLIRSLKGQE